MKNQRLLLVITAATLVCGCAHVVPLTPDSKWHTIYSVQIPSKSVELEIVAVNASRPECDRNRIPKTTEIRILLSESFQNFDDLPDKLENAKPREDGIPIKLADSGSYDLTLMGAKRLIPLITGKQLLARTSDQCAALKVTDLSKDRKK